MSKVAIITGADGGMGQEHVKAVSKAGYEVVMACRNPQKAWPICKELIAKTHNTNIRVMKLDLSSFASIYAFVEEIRKQFDYSTMRAGSATSWK